MILFVWFQIAYEIIKIYIWWCECDVLWCAVKKMNITCHTHRLFRKIFYIFPTIQITVPNNDHIEYDIIIIITNITSHISGYIHTKQHNSQDNRSHNLLFSLVIVIHELQCRNVMKWSFLFIQFSEFILWEYIMIWGK